MVTYKHLSNEWKTSVKGSLSGDLSSIMAIFLLPRVAGAAIYCIKSNNY